MTKVSTLMTTLLILTSFYSAAKEELSQLDKQKMIHWEMAKVKTQKQVQLELKDQDSPLYLLSEQGRKAFLDSIVYRETGLAGYNYRPLEAELTPTEIYKVLSLFGAQSTVYISQNA